jgi:hypothetical protein
MGSLFRGIRNIFKRKKTKKQERLEAPAGGQRPDTDHHLKLRKSKKKKPKVKHKNKKSKKKKRTKKKVGIGKKFPLRQQLKRRRGVHGV